MAQIIMPKLSDTMTEGVVVRWLKKEGDVVNMGDVLAEIETDKATMEMEAFDEGVLRAVYVQEGQKVNVGEPIALIGGEEEPGSPNPVEQIHAMRKSHLRLLRSFWRSFLGKNDAGIHAPGLLTSSLFRKFLTAKICRKV